MKILIILFIIYNSFASPKYDENGDIIIIGAGIIGMLTALELAESGEDTSKIKLFEKRDSYTRTQEIEATDESDQIFKLKQRLKNLGIVVNLPAPINKIEEAIRSQINKKNISVIQGVVQIDDGGLSYSWTETVKGEEGGESVTSEQKVSRKITSARAIIQADGQGTAFEDKRKEHMICYDKYDFVFLECSYDIGQPFLHKGSHCVAEISLLKEHCGVERNQGTVEEYFDELKKTKKCYDILLDAYIVKGRITKTPEVFSKVNGIPILRVGNSAAQFPFTSSLSTHRGSTDATAVVEFMKTRKTDERKAEATFVESFHASFQIAKKEMIRHLEIPDEDINEQCSEKSFGMDECQPGPETQSKPSVAWKEVVNKL